MSDSFLPAALPDSASEAPSPPRLHLIVGLGNPGKEYAGTRHNIGFELVDALAQAHKIAMETRRDKAVTGKGLIGAFPVMLVKPLTFMNLSGEAVAALAQKEQVALSNILIVCDDIHLPVGKLRLRPKGSSGGQNGLKSIAAHLGSQDWPRLRIGVGEPPPHQQVDWVLGKFSPADRPLIEDCLIRAMGAVEVWLREGLEIAMCRFNGDAPS